jgi:nucleotide-binding universal stress UspA family protein
MESQINSILIPTDFSESSERALTVGISIAKRQKAEIILLHVVDRFAYLEPTEVFLPDIRLTTDLNLLMEDKLSELSETIGKKTGIKVTGRVLDGLPSDRICRLAFDEKIDLIVLGTHGTSGMRKLFMGSDAYRVVKNAPSPVLTVPGDWQHKGFKKILFPIRLIPGALDKYFYSRPIIEKNNSELFLLGLTDMKNSENTKELIFLIENLKHQLHTDNVKFQTSYCPSEDFPSAVNQTANDFNIDLLILTANLDYDWKSFIVGPFVQQVINHSQIPVLSIKPSIDLPEQLQPFKLAEKWGKSLNLLASNEL